MHETPSQRTFQISCRAGCNDIVSRKAVMPARSTSSGGYLPPRSWLNWNRPFLPLVDQFTKERRTVDAPPVILADTWSVMSVDRSETKQFDRRVGGQVSSIGHSGMPAQP